MSEDFANASPTQVAERIGDILIRSGVMTTELLHDAVMLAERTNVSLDRVLEMNGYISAAGLSDAMRLTKMVENNEIGLDNACRAMELVGRQSVPLDTALRQLKKDLKLLDKSNNKLGQLLAQAGVISYPHFSEGLYDSLNTALPLGMVLVEKNVILPLILDWALSAQELVNKGTLNVDQAAQALRAARLKGTNLETELVAHGFPTTGLRKAFGIGDLLMMANTITETQLLAAREIGLVQGKELNDVLIENAIVEESIVHASGQLLQMMEEEAITIEHAAPMIRRLTQCKTVDEMVDILGDSDLENQVKPEPVDFLDLIGMCRLVTPEQLIEGLAESKKTKAPLVNTLVSKGMLSQTVLEAAMDCKRVLDSGVLDLEQGLIALTYSAEHEANLEYALRQFGWSKQLAALAT